MKVKNERFVTWTRAKKILESKAKTKELGYEQKNALEHLRKFSKLTDKKMNEMAEELGKISKLRERHIVSIMNTMPSDMDEVRMLFSNEVVSLTEDDSKKIISVVKKFS